MTPKTKGQKHSDPEIGPVAVIEIGSSSVRMTIAQKDGNEGIQEIDYLQQSISLGKDTFIDGVISRENIESCVQTIKSFLTILQEYGIDRAKGLRVVATTAVREARNKKVFLDRISIAAGISVEVLDETDVKRLSYLSIQKNITRNKKLSRATVAVTEIGGGSTELLVLRGKKVLFSEMYKLGSLRLREILESTQAPSVSKRIYLEDQIERTLAQAIQNKYVKKVKKLIIMGGEIRFAAKQILDTEESGIHRIIDIQKLLRFTDRILRLSVEETVERYNLSFMEAETLGPALLFCVQLANRLGVDNIFVTEISLRDGILMDMFQLGVQGEGFREHIIRSASDVAEKFSTDKSHGEHVAHLCDVLFKVFQDEHRLHARNALFLHVAALLHDVGIFISRRKHHKHSRYIIQNSDFFGLNKEDIMKVSLIARYHRKASPKDTHYDYMNFSREDRLTISKLGALLRVADALDNSHSQRIDDIACELRPGVLVIKIPNVKDLSLEEMALHNKGPLFQDVYGRKVVLERTGFVGAEHEGTG